MCAHCVYVVQVCNKLLVWGNSFQVLACLLVVGEISMINKFLPLHNHLNTALRLSSSVITHTTPSQSPQKGKWIILSKTNVVRRELLTNPTGSPTHPKSKDQMSLIEIEIQSEIGLREEVDPTLLSISWSNLPRTSPLKFRTNELHCIIFGPDLSNIGFLCDITLYIVIWIIRAPILENAHGRPKYHTCRECIIQKCIRECIITCCGTDVSECPKAKQCFTDFLADRLNLQRKLLT